MKKKNKLLSLRSYRSFLSKMPLLCVDAIVLNEENKILLLLRKDEPKKNQWWIPGGRVYKKERLSTAIKRKLHEEVGINKVKNLEEIGIYELFSPERLFSNIESGGHVVGIIFKAEIKSSQKIRVDEHHSNHKWADYEELSADLKKTLKRVRWKEIL